MIIKNARIYGEEPLDLELEKGIIKKIGKNLKGSKSLDAGSLTLLPSFVDLNVRLKNDKFSLENLALLEEKCLKSGISAVLLRDDMDFDEESLSLFLNHLKSLKVRIFTSVRALDKDKKLKNLSTLISKNAFAIELESASEANILRQSMQYALMKDVPLLVRCFESGFDDGGVMSDGSMSFKLGLVGISKVSELSEVAKIKQIAKFYGSRMLYDCLSLKQSLDLLDSSDEILISIHHLLKDSSACENFNTAAKLMPPLQELDDTSALLQRLKDDFSKSSKSEISKSAHKNHAKIKFLSALESAKPITHKDLAFDEASFGIDSLGEFMSLCNTFLVQKGILSWRHVCELASLNGAKFLGLNCGEIKVGKEANFVLFDENLNIKIKENSLYAKDKLKGEVKAHFLNGELIF